MSKIKSYVLIIKKRGLMLNRFSSKIWTYDHLKHCNAPPCKYAWSVGNQSTDKHAENNDNKNNKFVI